VPIKFENSIRKSTELNVKFNVKTFELSQNKITAGYNEMLPGKENLKSFFKELEKKYGEFSFKKMIPRAKWGDTLFYDKTTGESRHLIDISQLYTIKFDHFVNIDSIITAIEKIQFVSYAEPPIQAVNINDPNDLIGGATGSQWNLYKIGAPKAWGITKGSADIKVAEIDVASAYGSGPDKNHPDFQLPDGSSKFADGGYPTVGSPQDHATEVCGIIGATTNNGIGIASLGWNSKILSFYFSDQTSNLSSAIYDAVAAGADVLNCSFITRSLTSIKIGSCTLFNSWNYQSVNDAIEYAIAHNVVVVAGTGDRGYELTNGGCTVQQMESRIPYIPYPAAYNGVIAVSGTDINDHFAENYNYEGEGAGQFSPAILALPGGGGGVLPFMSVSAPAIDVISTSVSNSYSVIRGTSFSSPLVAALVGLIKTILPTHHPLTPSQIKTILQNTAEKVDAQNHPYDGTGRNGYLGYGRINAYEALKYTLEHYGGTLTQGLTIPAGETWNFEPGVTLRFLNGSSLTVNGTLLAQGSSSPITFTTSSGTSPGTWGSIIFNGSGSSNSILNNVVVRYGSGIQCLNGADITIRNSTIGYCTQGIYVYNSSPGIFNNQIIEPQQNGIYGEASGLNIYAQDNTITKTSSSGSYYQNYQGIWFTNGTVPVVIHNDISGFYWGMYFGGGVVANFITDLYSTNNRITNNFLGIGSAWGSTVLAGLNSLYGGYNSIHSNTVSDVECYQNSELIAEYNYWSGGQPNASVEYGSTFDAANILTSDPWGVPIMPSATNNNKVSQPVLLSSNGTANINSDISDILAGLSLEKNGKIDDAINHYKIMLQNGKHVSFALAKLANIKNKFSKNEVQNYLESLSGKTPDDLRINTIIAGLYLQDGLFDKAIKLFDKIINSKGDEYQRINARFEKLFAYLNIKKDSKTAGQILADIKSMDLKEKVWQMRIEVADQMLGKDIELNKSISKETTINKENKITGKIIPDKYSLFANYPNPFNPSTVIRYDLPKDGLVTIKVYDILGRKVTTLVNEFKAAGKYSVTFNAGNLASGVYIYQLGARGFVINKKLVLMK
jgi:tetratricopeptide (TPR) repeat protein